MPDIFISYSRQDTEQAQLLTELLSSAGLSVWIDHSGIQAATSWSEEIVNALDGCKAFIVMLSPSSIESKNVVREVALAFEKNKKILPLDLEPVSLPASMQYHLAGLQRTSMSNIDSVIRALSKLGLEATGAPQAPKIVKESDGRKTLMILPFQDLSPTGDNGWFADGIVSELISALSNAKALNVTDAQTTRDFKRYQGTLPKYAREMGVRYFVEGDVRKFGDNIKITARLLDIESGDHLWQDSIKGTMADVFEIQEQVAVKVLDGLKLHLTSDEKQKLAERGTENAEAYELYLKAGEYFVRQMKEGFQLAVQLLTEAIKLDPGYANAYSFKANALAAMYSYDRNPELLIEAESLCNDALRIKPDLLAIYYPLSVIYRLQGRLAEAEEAAREFIRRAPDNFYSHFSLGLFYANTGQFTKSIAPYEESVRLMPESRVALFNLAANYSGAKDMEQCAQWAHRALPIEERHLKLHPNDEGSQQHHAMLLFWVGRADEARQAAIKLKDAKDGASLYNIAGLFAMLGDKPEALATIRKAIEAGFRNIRLLKSFLDDDDDGLASLRGMPEYEEVQRKVEKIVAEEEATKPNA